MKTKMNNLKKAVLTATAVLLLASVTYTQSGLNNKNLQLASLAKMENLITNTESSVMYIAPSVAESDNYSPEMENLDRLMAATEAALKYKAPAVADYAAPIMDRLDQLVSATESSLKYAAPSVVEIESVYAELERLDQMTAVTEASLKYTAPEVNETGATSESFIAYTTEF